jgi:hypothetical protein
MATPEERTGRYWCGVAFSNVALLAEEVGWERAVEKYLGGVRGRASKVTAMLLEKLKVKERDATVPIRMVEAVVPTILPGWKTERIEFSPERSVGRYTGTCIMWEVVKELGIQERLPVVRICETFMNECSRLVNPKITTRHPKGMCKGDPHCEFVVELEE